MSAAALRHAAPGRAPPLVEGEFLFTAEDFTTIAAVLHEDSGIYLPEAKATLVYSRLAKRLRALGLRAFADYCELVTGPEGRDERRSMLAALTTNVTRFFREPHHFDHLRQHVLPPLLQAARKGERVRLWSAGCSTGQEPYSMALTLLGMMPDIAQFDVRILATDIDPVVVGTAREGVYSEDSAAPIPPEMRRWLSPAAEAGGWRVGEEMRRLIAFRELNLLGAWPMKGRFHAVFCRNVAIYFEDSAQQRLWERFAGVLAPTGRLYVGHSERATAGVLEQDGLTTYRLRESRA
jgi:chemotaxis protein methyltransferase CheR